MYTQRHSAMQLQVEWLFHLEEQDCSIRVARVYIFNARDILKLA